jgi:hypothetical protein
MLERNNFNRIKITGRLKMTPNSGLRDAASEVSLISANKDKVVRAG